MYKHIPWYIYGARISKHDDPLWIFCGSYSMTDMYVLIELDFVNVQPQDNVSKKMACLGQSPTIGIAIEMYL